MGRAGGIRGRGLRGDDTVELIVTKGLRAGGVEIVGDAVDVARVLARSWVDKVIGDVNGVATGGCGLNFGWLETIIEGFREIEASERGRLANAHAVDGALRGVAHGAGETAG